MKLYLHKKAYCLKLSKTYLVSRYLIPAKPIPLPKEKINLQYFDREMIVTTTKNALWIALETDSGFQLHYQSKAIFTLNNEKPLTLFIEDEKHRLYYYALQQGIY